MEKKVPLDILIKQSKLNNFDINKSLKIKSYLPLEDKIKYAKIYVDKIIDEHGNYSSIDKYFKFTMMVFNVYTNLYLDNTHEEYDKLISSGLLDDILNVIKNDYYDFKEFVEMEFNDKLRILYMKH